MSGIGRGNAPGIVIAPTIVLAEIRRLTRFVCHYEKEFAALMMGFTQQAHSCNGW